MPEKITIALSKGRVYEEAVLLLAKLDICPLDDPEKSRKLIVRTDHEHIDFLIIRSVDVPTYVERGVAELGIVGKDMLMEYTGHGFYEPLDLGIAKCQMMLAGIQHPLPIYGRPKVATKYVNVTRHYFAAQGQQVDIIKLYGSMELAPLLKLSDWIVDLVDTGNTLRANGLVTLAHIADISSRLIVNKAAMKMKHHTIKPIIEQLKGVVRNNNNAPP